MEKLIVKIEDKEFNAEILSDNPNLALDGEPVQTEILKRLGPNSFAFSINGKVIVAQAFFDKRGVSKINVEGYPFEVEIVDETKKLFERYLRNKEGASGGGYVKVTAPMPGLVLKILVEEGQKVKKGETVAIVEAMKMENALAAPKEGVVKSIKAKERDAVEKNAVLIEIE